MKYLFVLLQLAVLMNSCTKILDEKPSRSLVVPTKISELRALLDNTSQAMNRDPGLIEITSDNLVLPETLFPRLLVHEVNSYIWKGDLNEGVNPGEWDLCYKQILYANVVLGELDKFGESTKLTSEWKDLFGSALFYRAYAYFNLAKTFCLGYSKSTANSTIGLQIKRSSDFSNSIQRSSLQETFDFIIDDLATAAGLLNDKPAYLTRPSKWAAFAMLSRVYLYLGDYENTIESATNCLGIDNTLINYQEIDGSSTQPFTLFNQETIFYSELVSYLYQIFWGATISQDYFNQYQDGDLRKTHFFDVQSDRIKFKGQYTGKLELLGGLAVDEVLLDRAESFARLGKTQEALSDLNRLLENRYDNTFIPYEESDANQLIRLILKEREKELIFRGIRWSDLKRLNTQPEFARDITRMINGDQITLISEDLRYAFPIPDEEINLSGIQQNAR